MKLKLFITIFALSLILLASFAEGQQVFINSDDWREIYGAVFFTNFVEGSGKAHFMIDREEGIQWMQQYTGRNGKAVYVEGKKPIFSGLKPFLLSREFQMETLRGYGRNLPLELAARTDAKKFIIVDDVYGYNAIAVAPYGLLTKSFVLFANKENIEEVVDLLNLQDAESVMLYGRLDPEVRAALDIYDPVIINSGDKFKDNVEIVERFMDIQEVNQVIFTQGQMIEEGLFTNAYPNILIGAGRVPSTILDFLKRRGEIRAAIMTGHEGTGIASMIKEKTGIRVLIKFARGVATGGQKRELYALNTFPIPVHKGKVILPTARYNMLTQEVEIVYENPTEVPVYALGIAHDLLLDGELIKTLSDEAPVLVDKKEKKTVIYKLNLMDYKDEVITVSSEIFYGEQPGALEKIYAAERDLSFIEVNDLSSISLEKVLYDKTTGEFKLTVKNNGQETVYVRPRILNLKIGGAKESVSGDQIAISKRQTEIVTLEADLSQKDIQDNQKIKVSILFGAREDALVKSLKEKHDLTIETTGYLIYGLLSIILIVLILWVWTKKR